MPTTNTTRTRCICPKVKGTTPGTSATSYIAEAVGTCPVHGVEATTVRDSRLGINPEPVIKELAARWHRAEARKQEPRDHDHGRQEGYAQAIALLLGLTTREVRTALASGQLKPEEAHA
jgi:hypothetical protein